MTLNELFKVMIGGVADAKGEPSVFNSSCGGGAKGSRTPDLLNAIQTRYQLRYDPITILNSNGIPFCRYPSKTTPFCGRAAKRRQASRKRATNCAMTPQYCTIRMIGLPIKDGVFFWKKEQPA